MTLKIIKQFQKFLGRERQPKMFMNAYRLVVSLVANGLLIQEGLRLRLFKNEKDVGLIFIFLVLDDLFRGNLYGKTRSKEVIETEKSACIEFVVDVFSIDSEDLTRITQATAVLVERYNKGISILNTIDTDTSV